MSLTDQLKVRVFGSITLGNRGQWGDLPAWYHNGAAGFSFADGHSEIHKWQSGTSPTRITTSSHVPRPVDAAGRRDFDWLWKRTSVPYKQ